MKYSFLIFFIIFYFSYSIEINIFHGDKIFNKNTPIILNLLSQDTNEQKSNVDLICIIDISGSMNGNKILLVKESLKKLISLMTDKDRISIVLFNHQSFKILDLTYTTSSNKIEIINKINNIKAGGGTIIINGLQCAIDILKVEQMNNKNNEEYKKRIPSLILLSDGNDNNMNEIQLSENLKEITKNLNLFFTLHTFGYGNDHDPKIMNKLANIRDGSFYYVSEFNKVKDYFINVLGGCMSVISNYVIINVNSNFTLKKVFGEDDMYSYNFNGNHFDTQILQFISGKEYTYVFEIDLPDFIKDGEKILDVEIKYVDNNNNKEVVEKKDFYYQNKFEVVILEKANEEYIRSMTYEIMKDAMNYKEKNQVDEAKNILNKMKNWLSSNYKGKENYKDEIDSSINLIEDDNLYNVEGRATFFADIREGQRKYGGSKLRFSNALQRSLIRKVI